MAAPASAGATPSRARDFATKGYVDGVLLVTINVQTGTTYTLVLADGTAPTAVEMNNASPNTLTVPPNSSVAFPVGTQIIVRQTGAGKTTIAAGSGVTINSRGGVLGSGGQWAAMALTKRATNTWALDGDIA